MSKLILILLFLSSCTLSRYYKVKDLNKSFNKYDKSLIENEKKLKADTNSDLK